MVSLTVPWRLFYADDGVMREELYEQYKQLHPEELTAIDAVKAYAAAVEADRASIIAEKLGRVRKWKDILNREGEQNGEAGGSS